MLFNEPVFLFLDLPVVAVGVVLGLAISRTLSQPTTFLYFRF